MEENLKQLLLKDLCARLPYGVKIHTSFMGHENIEDLVVINKDAMLGDYASIVVNPVEEDINDGYELENVKPYLRPMSSMTEEEDARRCAFLDDIEGGIEDAIPNYIDWLNAHNFDYRGLIPKGLALEAKEGMYKTK